MDRPTKGKDIPLKEDDPEIKAWDELGSRFLEESKTDLEISYQLSRFQDDGSKRRRLFFLQQALEKCVKSSLPELGVTMMIIPYFSSSHIFAEHRTPGKPLDILLERGKRIFNAFKNPRDLSHNPAKRLEIKAFLEDCYLFALAVGDLGWAETCLACTKLMKERSIPRTISEIEKESREFDRIRTEGARILQGVKNPKSISKEQAGKLFAFLREATFHETKKSCLTLTLLELLAEFEQVSRYPDTVGLPKGLLDDLNRVHETIQRLVSESDQRNNNSEEIFNPIELLLQRGKFSEENVRNMVSSTQGGSAEAQ